MTTEITTVSQETARVVTSGLRFPEGGAVDADGSVLVPEIEGGAIVRVRPDGSTQVVAEVGGGANGCAFGPDGALYVCNDGGVGFGEAGGLRFPVGAAENPIGARLQRVDLATGAVETVLDSCDGEPMVFLNDIVFDAAGGAYVADTLRNVVYYTDPIARTIRVAAQTITPNGAGLSPDGTRLYVSETFTGRVRVWEVTGPGELSELPDLLQHAPIEEGQLFWDGLAVDGAGNICIADQPGSAIQVIAPDGTPRGRFTLPEPDAYVTNLCFGTGDTPTAYVSSGGRGLLYAVTWPWPALRLNFQP